MTFDKSDPSQPIMHLYSCKKIPFFGNIEVFTDFRFGDFDSVMLRLKAKVSTLENEESQETEVSTSEGSVKINLNSKPTKTKKKRSRKSSFLGRAWDKIFH